MVLLELFIARRASTWHTSLGCSTSDNAKAAQCAFSTKNSIVDFVSVHRLCTRHAKGIPGRTAERSGWGCAGAKQGAVSHPGALHSCVYCHGRHSSDRSQLTARASQERGQACADLLQQARLALRRCKRPMYGCVCLYARLGCFENIKIMPQHASSKATNSREYYWCRSMCSQQQVRCWMTGTSLQSLQRSLRCSPGPALRLPLCCSLLEQ